jgi:hypothetical protein
MTTMRVQASAFHGLPLEAHALLVDIPLRDVSAVGLPGGGPGRTMADVRALLPAGPLGAGGPLARALFAVRRGLGRLFGWDRPEHDDADASYLSRVSAEVRARSQVAPGTPEGPFRLLYLLDGESLVEIHNATVHAFLCAALREHAGGYRLYWAVYVKPTSWLTPFYMALIEPFRRFIVYPSLLAQIRRAWMERYAERPK